MKHDDQILVREANEIIAAEIQSWMKDAIEPVEVLNAIEAKLTESISAIRARYTVQGQ